MITHQPDILDRLRAETRPQHDRLEEVAASDKLASGSLTPEEYTRLLEANYIAHRRLEGAIRQVAGMDSLVADRQKQALLEQDLRQAGIDPEAVWEKRKDLLPHAELQGSHQALGAQYVMEGATLGGVVILKALHQHPQLQSYQPFHYYGCYGGDTGRQWSGFKQLLRQQVQDTAQENAVLEGCRRAYALFEKAFLAVQM
ncbi:biliverdin-producing heme oxygenase [Cesiribacter andamanensis]|uniref:Heme oxygenase n=1 Tax=Cesiribacter andamanensis AMV16 TaxID=1279009 RepID=M7N842_9BACT|nr:biliverdin-producing heme oxygenase [Cesiribacter andamanensis]EMR03376.1 Heme oxygenase [Cesiribacter andamanensis AMV16]